MTSRDQILRDIRRSLPTDAPLPSLDGPWTRYDDPHAQFFAVLQTVGGSGRMVRDETDLRAEIDRIAATVGASHICSAVSAVSLGKVDLPATDDPHALASVDLAILPGELAVAENAAVWVTNRAVHQRVAYFLSQHVVLIVPGDRVVSNMHEAYAWIRHSSKEQGPFHEASWGTFMSGPSKTADIEQALVIGAHGARSLHVLFTPP